MELRVIRWRDGWRILMGGRARGDFRYRVDAEEAALKLGAKLTVETVDGRFRELETVGSPGRFGT